MGLFDIFKSGRSSQFETLLKDLVNEADHKKPEAYSDPPYHQLESIKKLQKLPQEELAPFIVFLLQTAKSDWLKQKSFSWSSVWYHSLKTVDHLLKHADFSTASLDKIALAFKEIKQLKRQPHNVPGMALLAAMQRAIGKHGYASSTKDILKSLLNPTTEYSSSDQFKENDLILFLLQEDPSLEIAEHDRWGAMVIQHLRNSTADTRKAWVALFVHCKKGTGKSTPTGKWLIEADVLLEKLRHDVFATQLVVWLQHLQNMLQDIHRKTSNDFLRDENHEVVKGLIWCTGIINQSALNSAVENYAVWAYKKMAGVGSLSVKTGTAAMVAFSMLPVNEGVARLSKFRIKIKNNSILKSIDKILRSVSEKNGLALSAMEELAVPDFGISNEEITVTLENFIARHSFNTGEITWLRGDKIQKSIPADIKKNFSEEVKSFKKVIREAEEMLLVVRSRLEQSYLQSREWDYASWYELYIDHPLTSLIAKN